MSVTSDDEGSDGVRIVSVELRRLELELIEPLVTSAARHDRRPLHLVTVTTEHATGVGECSALADAGYVPETAEIAGARLAHQMLPALVAGGGVEADVGGHLARIGPSQGREMAFAAVEGALLDADLRSKGRSLADEIGAVAPTVEAGATVGLGAVDEVARRAVDAVARGFTRVKVKIAPGHDTDVVLAVRRAVGPKPRISVDANGSYDLADRAHLDALRALDHLGLAAIEQPFPPSDLESHAVLRRFIRTPIVLDESVVTMADLERALEIGAADAVSIKPARVGGVAASLALVKRAVAGGCGLTIGGMLEGGVARAVTLAVGALPGFTLPGDVGPSWRYFARDISTPHEMIAGAVEVPRGPGIGVELAMDVVEAATVAVTTFRPH